jgi:hypothetical protein
MKYYYTLIAILLSCASVCGQENFTGTIKGRIIDKANKQPVIGASVAVKETTNGVATDTAGIFRITGVSEGVYQLVVNYIGYQEKIISDVSVYRGKTNYLEIEIEESQRSLKEVQVTGFKFENSPLTPVSTYSFSREEISRNPGAQGDIFRAIGMLPGVSSSGGQYSAIAVRGQGVRDNIYMVDDIPVSEVGHLEGNGAFNDPNGARFSIFAPRVIDNAVFQGGGIAAQYGRRSASYLGLGIKEGNREDYTIDGQVDLLGITANYDGPSYFDKNTSIFASARYQDFRAVVKVVGLKGIGTPWYADFILKTTTQLGKKNKLSVIAIVSPDEYLKELKDIKEPTEILDAGVITVQTQKSIFGLNLRTLTGKNSYWKNVAYFTQSVSDVTFGKAYPTVDSNDHIVNPNGYIPVENNIRVLKYRESKLGYRSIYTVNFANHSRLNIGAEADRTGLFNSRTMSRTDTSYSFGANDLRPDPSHYFALIDPKYFNASFDDYAYNASAYADYSFLAFRMLTINAGLRYDYSGFTDQHTLSPRLSGNLQLNATNSINFAAGLYYQDPVYSEIADQPKDKKLQEEQVTQYILGYKKHFSPDLKFTAEVWYKNFDKMVARPVSGYSEQNNAGTGWANGFDLNLTKRLTKKIHGQIGYSYMQSKRDDHDGYGEYDFAFSQPHQVNCLLSYQAKSRWILSAKFRYATGKPTDKVIIHSNIFNDPNNVRYSEEIVSKNTDRLEDFISLDVRADYSFHVRKLRLTWFVDIVDILNRSNQNDRFVNIYNGKYIYDGLAIFPSFGLKFEY